MLLTDDRGNTVDYFHRFPPGQNIGLALSGGTDSALLLFLLIEMVYRRKERVNIYPIHGYDTARKNTQSWQAAENVHSWIESYYLDAWEMKLLDYLKPLEIFSYEKDGDSKEKHHQPHYRYMKERYDIPFIIRGMSQGMPDETRPNQDIIQDKDLYEMGNDPNSWVVMPWSQVDKKFIYHQYKKYDIMELSKLTVSCIGDPGPCRKCFWCRERKWAFGNYDRGLL